MSTTSSDQDLCEWMSITTVIRIERVHYFDHEDYTQIDADCLTMDMFGEVFDLTLHHGADDAAELNATKALLKPGEIYMVKDQGVSWGGGYMTLCYPELLAFNGNKSLINKDLDGWYLHAAQQMDWATNKRPQRIKGRVLEFKISGTKRRGSMAIAHIETEIGIVEGHIFPQPYKHYREFLDSTEELIFFGVVQRAEESEDNKTRMMVDAIRRPKD